MTDSDGDGMVNYIEQFFGMDINNADTDNEEEQLLEALDTTVRGNCASAVVSHFSKYILINRTVYEESFE